MLRLSMNSIGPQGMARLTAVWGQGRGQAGLTELCLRNNRLGPEGGTGLAELIRGGGLPKLARLWLQGNRCGDLAAHAVAQALAGAPEDGGDQSPPALLPHPPSPHKGPGGLSVRRLRAGPQVEGGRAGEQGAAPAKNFDVRLLKRPFGGHSLSGPKAG